MQNEVMEKEIEALLNINLTTTNSLKFLELARVALAKIWKEEKEL